MNEDKNKVSWILPASKKDPNALGEERTHGCLCDEQTVSELCPCHAIKELLQVRFPEDADDGSGPLFLTNNGQRVSK